MGAASSIGKRLLFCDYIIESGRKETDGAKASVILNVPDAFSAYRSKKRAFRLFSVNTKIS